VIYIYENAAFVKGWNRVSIRKYLLDESPSGSALTQSGPAGYIYSRSSHKHIAIIRRISMDTENPRAYACLGETVIKSNMTLGQAIEAIAFAHIKTKLPQLGDKCKCAMVTFADGKFVVRFAEDKYKLF
jgi:hypothetical protein